jgi:hypothetical protein
MISDDYDPLYEMLIGSYLIEARQDKDDIDFIVRERESTEVVTVCKCVTLRDQYGIETYYTTGIQYYLEDPSLRHMFLSLVEWTKHKDVWKDGHLRLSPTHEGKEGFLCPPES